MQLIRGQQHLRTDHRGNVVTIGNFDGVHLGHQYLLRKLSEVAVEFNVPSLVITFEPYPREFLTPREAPARLTTLREKLTQFKKFSPARILCLRFDAQFANLSAEDFIETILVSGLGTRHLIVGEDFRFGHQRRGDVTMLQDIGRQRGFTVSTLTKISDEGTPISSTRIRTALKLADFSAAATLLGRPYSINSRVIMGDQRGRTIGFPTLNLPMHRLVSPLHGVYAVKVRGFQGRILTGVANVGIRPTVGGEHFLLEVHVFDFNENAYGCHLEVEFIEKIRDERKFDSFALLREQIDNDAEAARQVFDRLLQGRQ